LVHLEVGMARHRNNLFSYLSWGRTIALKLDRKVAGRSRMASGYKGSQGK
jgi:hypothetical protein